MPRYDFRCTPCQWTFEAKIPFGSDERPVCPQCGKRATEQIIVPPLGIHFHGSGFYKTDSRPVEKKSSPPEKSPAPEAPKEKTPDAPPSPPVPNGSVRAGNSLPVRPGHPGGPRGEGIPGAPKTEKKGV